MKRQPFYFGSNLEMTWKLDDKMFSMAVRNAAPVTYNAVESNMVMKQPIVLTIHSIDHAHLSPSADQL